MPAKKLPPAPKPSKAYLAKIKKSKPSKVSARAKTVVRKTKKKAPVKRLPKRFETHKLTKMPKIKKSQSESVLRKQLEHAHKDLMSMHSLRDSWQKDILNTKLALGDLNTKFKEVHESVDSIENISIVFKDVIKSMKAMGAMNKRMDRVVDALISTEKHDAKLTKEIEAINFKLASVDALKDKLNKFNKIINSVEKQHRYNNDFSDSIKELNHKVGIMSDHLRRASFDDRMVGLEDATLSFSDKLGNIDAKSTTISASVEGIAGKLKNFEDRVAELDNQIGRLSNVTSKINPMAAELDSHEQEYHETENRVSHLETMQSQMNTITGNMAALNGNLTMLADKLRQIEKTAQRTVIIE